MAVENKFEETDFERPDVIAFIRLFARAFFNLFCLFLIGRDYACRLSKITML